MTPRESASGKKYGLWKVTDLAGFTCSLFLFGDAFEAHWKESEGSVVGLVNAKYKEVRYVPHHIIHNFLPVASSVVVSRIPPMLSFEGLLVHTTRRGRYDLLERLLLSVLEGRGKLGRLTWINREVSPGCRSCEATRFVCVS